MAHTAMQLARGMRMVLNITNHYDLKEAAAAVWP
jgi:hypothetical protein